MATFHRLFEYALEHGKAKIEPKNLNRCLTAVRQLANACLTLELFDLDEYYRQDERIREYIDRCKCGEWDDQDWSDCREAFDWQAVAAGVEDPKPSKRPPPPKKEIYPDLKGRYCLRITLTEGISYVTCLSGYFYYLPKEQIIEVDDPSNRGRFHLGGIRLETLETILGKFYDQLPGIRVESK